MNIRFLDLRVCSEEQEQFISSMRNMLTHGQIVRGPEIEEFEHNITQFLGVSYAVGVSSGSIALSIALQALNIGPEHEVIVPAMSFVASANAIAMVGASPIFADIDDDFSINIESIKQCISAKTKAIMVVHYGGKIANIPKILEIAKQYNLLVIEDASQAFGARLDNTFSGTFGDIGCFSLNPMKILAAVGEAGVVVTNNQEIYQKLIALRYNGMPDKDTCMWIGTNARIDTIQAAVLSHRLTTVSELIAKRQHIARYYRSQFGHLVTCPQGNTDTDHVYYTFTILTDHREDLARFLMDNGIEVKVYHGVIPHQPAYKIWAKGKWENAEKLYKTKLSIPCHEKLTPQEYMYVAQKVCAFFAISI